MRRWGEVDGSGRLAILLVGEVIHLRSARKKYHGDCGSGRETSSGGFLGRRAGAQCSGPHYVYGKRIDEVVEEFRVAKRDYGEKEKRATSGISNRKA